jgi:DNA-binding transcriptional MerR regulator
LNYTIKEIAEKFNLTEYTIRYYDKEGLLPFIERNKSGIRIFTDSDMEWLNLICCLKNTGMQLKQIKQYISWCMEGEETLEIRRQMFIEHRKEVLKQIEELKKNLSMIDYKIKYYDTACNVCLKGNQISFGPYREELRNAS